MEDLGNDDLENMEDDTADSSDSSDDSSSDSEGDEQEDDIVENREEVDKQILQLQNEITENQYLYSKHVELVQLLAKIKDATQLRAARERMSHIFPLSEELWLQWLKDDVESPDCQQLFERAIQDYASVDIWLEYIYYSMRGMSEPDGIQNVRNTFEKAITHVGIHVARGALIWEAYREFEIALLAGMQTAPGKVPTQDEQNCLMSQMERIKKLFKRQMSVPLLGMEKTLDEYREWCTGESDAQTDLTYEKSLAALNKLRPFEDKLKSSAEPHLEEYNAYIEYEISQGDPTRIQSIYERAIKDNCLVPELWIKYTTYLGKELKISSLVLAAHARSVRNCPWTVVLWVNYLQALERLEEPRDKIKATLNDALLAGFTLGAEYLQLWMAYLDFLRRQIDWSSENHEEELTELRNCFERAINQLYEFFSETGDPTCSLSQYWAFIEAKYCHNMSKARELWSHIMQSGFGNQAHMWLEYVKLERAFGDAKHCRKIFQKAVNSVSDWPESVFDAYMKFEREEGDLLHYEESVERCASQLKRVEERRAKEAEKEAQLNDRKKKTKDDKKNLKKQQQPPSQFKQGRVGFNNEQTTFTKKSSTDRVTLKPYTKTRPTDKQNVQSDKTNINPVVYVRGAAEKRKLTEEDEESSQPSMIQPPPIPKEALEYLDREGFKIPPPPGYIPKPAAASKNPPPGYIPRPTPEKQKESPNEGVDESPAKRLKVADDEDVQAGTNRSARTGKESCTVFISNLDYSVTDDQLREIFCGVGQVVDVRIINNFKGRSKGYGYVEFSDEFAVANALKIDRQPIEGRPMFVSPCNPTRSSDTKLKFSVGLEKNKLFIKNLSLTITKEDLETAFAPHGKLKEVRLVTYRNGRPKGLAYVEYEDQASAGQAVLKMDGVVMADQPIAVAISNPPPRNAPMTERDHSSFVPSLGGGKKDTSSGSERIHSTQRNRLSFLPRAVSKPTVAKESEVNGKTDKSQGEQTGSKMSNEQFRNMLLK